MRVIDDGHQVRDHRNDRKYKYTRNRDQKQLVIESS